MKLDLNTLFEQHNLIPRGIIHVGAYQGKDLKRYPTPDTAKILLIEANPKAVEQLQANFANQPNIRVIHNAIANHNNSVTLNITSIESSSSILPLTGYQEIYPNLKTTQQITVDSHSLDNLLEELNLRPADFNFLFLDIQGAEFLALQGATELLKHIEAIYTTVSFEELFEGAALIDQVDTFLSEHHFIQVTQANPYHPAWGEAFYIRKQVITGSTLDQVQDFGDQLFQYAFLKLYAQQHHLTVETPAWVGQQLFGYTDPPISEVLPVRLEDIRHPTIANSEELINFVDFQGNFKYHTRYYALYKAEFRALFKATLEIEVSLEKALNQLRDYGKTIVGIYLEFDQESFVIPVDWYLEWLRGFWETLEEPVLYIASNHPEHIPLEEFADYHPLTAKDLEIECDIAPFYPDFYLLSHCDAVAISNSTFGFVASLLNSQGQYFFRPHLTAGKFIAFNPWNSEPTLKFTGDSPSPTVTLVAETKLHQTQAELAKMQSDYQQLKTELEQTQHELEQSNTHKNDVLIELEQSKNQTENLHKELNKSQADSDKLQTELDKSQTKSQKLQTELEQSQADSKKLQTELQAELEQSQTKSQQLQTELDKSQTKSQQLQTELEQSQADSDKLQTELDKSQADSDKLKTELDKSQADSDKLKTELDKSQAELKQLQEQFKTTQSQQQKTQKELDESRSELHQTREELELTQFQLDEIQVELEQAQSQLHQTKQELEESQSQLQISQVEFKQNQSKINHAEHVKALAKILAETLETKESHSLGG
ncbi:MAG: FkbM family methyltransferase [Microcoleaceae cyanobacterium]